MDLSQKRAAMENPTSLVFDRKFDTAIRDTFYKNFKQRLNPIPFSNVRPPTYIRKRYDPLILDHMETLGYREKDFCMEPHHYGIFLTKIINLKNPVQGSVKGDKRRINSLVNLIMSNVEIQSRYAHHHNYTLSKNVVMAKLANWISTFKMPVILQNLLEINRLLSNMVDISNIMFSEQYQKLTDEEYKRKMIEMNQYYIEMVDARFYWSESLSFIIIDDAIFCMPRSVLLMYHNKVSDLISILSYAIFAESSSEPIDAFISTVKFVQEMCKLLCKYKNKSFSIFKVLEGLVSAETLLEVDGWVNDEFLTNLCDELFVDLKFDYMGSRLRELITSYDIPFRHEISCLSKIVGHPLVDVKKGAKSLFVKTTSPVSINMVKVRECVYYFTRDYIKKHIQRHNRWPPTVLMPRQAPLAIRMAQLYNKDPDSKYIVDKFGRTHIDHYAYVELEKNIEFNKMENILPYLKDKTISLLRSQVIGKYFDNLKPEREWENTRLLISYLINEDLMKDHIKFMDKFSNCTDFNQLLNYLMIKIVPKEKELKINFRGFGCMTHLNRFRLLVQEKNVSHFMDEYIDEQTMTISELAILKRLDAFRRITKAYNGYRVLYLVVDASSWNNRFSARTVDDMFKSTLGKLFNNPIVSKVNEPYEHTFVYVPDENEMYYWEGQRGGIEGQNQYSWMVAYINQIKVAMTRFPFKYHILCKGDDLRIVVLVPEVAFNEDMLGQLKNQIVDEISTVCGEFGHVINIEESYGSAHYFAFSKAASVDTVELPQVYRKIQKCYGANNAFINVLDDYVSSTFSNGHSACKVGTNTVPIYCTSLLWFFVYLTRHPQYTKLTNDQLLALSLTPSVVGGFPIIYLHNFAIRAESDLLAPFLDLLVFCKMNYPTIYEPMSNFLYLKDENPINYTQIFIDPYSIPISRPSLPATILKSYIPDQVKRICKNRDLIALMKLVKSPEQQMLIEALSSCNVLRARALSVLYSCTPEALLSEYLGQFESGKSVLDLLLIRRSRRHVHFILRQVLKGEIRLQSWRYYRLLGKNLLKDVSVHHLLTECPNQSATAIREYMFKKPVEDVSMPPLQHQMWMCHDGMSRYGDWIDNNHFNYKFECNEDQPIATTDGREHYTVGPYQPFIGYKTKTGQVAPTVNFIEKDSTLKKIRMIMEVCEWMNVSRIMPDGTELTSNISTLGQTLLALYTDIDLTRLSPFSGKKKSGTAQHHMRSPSFKESIVPNLLSNSYTKFKGETNSHNRLTSSHQHYKINFLHCYCYMVWISSHELEFDKHISIPKTFWGVTTNCHHCNLPITETPLVFDEALIVNITLPLLRITKINIVAENILMKSLEQDGLKVPNIRQDEQMIDYVHACQGILGQMINTLYTDRNTMMDRFSHHVLNNEGHNIMSILSGGGHDRDVGLTELKSVDSNIMVDILLPLINQMIYQGVFSDTREEQQRWLLTTPIHIIPWYPIVQWLLNAGKLSSVMTICYNNSRLPVTGGYHDVHVATRYLGICAIHCLPQFQPNHNIVFLSHFQTTSILIFVKSIIRCYRNKYLNGIDWPLVTATNVRSDNERKWTTLCYLMRYVCIYRLLDLEDDILLNLLNPIIEHTRPIMQVIDYDSIQPDTFELWVNELFEDPTMARNRQLSGIINKLHLLYPNYTEAVERYLDEELDNLTTYIQGNENTIMPPLTIHYVSLSDCIHQVREHRVMMAQEGQNDNHIADEEIEMYLDNIHQNRENNRVHRLDQDIARRNQLLHRGQLLSMDQVGLPYIGNEEMVYPPFANVAPTSHFAHMIYGHSNNSQSVWHNIMSSLVPFNRRGTELVTAVVLHDGLGGVTNVLDQYISDSLIYFHTTPTEEYIYAPEPSDALNNQNQENNNRIIYEYLRTGYTKLTNPEVLTKLCGIYKACDLLFSDLEHPEPTSDDYLTLHLHMIELMSRILVMDSMAILKLDLVGYNNCVIIIVLLRMLFNRILIVYPYGDEHYTNIYVVVSGKRPEMRADTSIIIHELKTVQDVQPHNYQAYLCSETYVFLQRFHHRVHRHFEEEWGLSIMRPIQYHIDPHAHDPIVMLQNLGCYGEGRFVASYKVCPGLEPDTLTQNFHLLINNHNKTEYIKQLEELSISIKPVIIRITSDLQRQRRAYNPRQAWDTDTQAHRQAVLTQLYGLIGFQTCLENVVIQGRTLTISYRQLREFIVQHMRMWIPRDITREQVPLLAPYENGTPPGSTYLAEFNKGIKTCITLLMYHFISNTHIEH